MTQPSTTTVGEVSDGYEKQEDDDKTVPASERLLPDEIARNTPVSNLLTRNWRDNASSLSVPVEKQLLSFMMILAYMYLGTATYANTESTYQGALAVAYGA